MSHSALAHRAVGALPTERPRGIHLDPGALHRIADSLYDGIEGDPILRKKFGRDLEIERAKLGAFFVEFFLGEPEWNRTLAFGDLAGPHRFIHISEADAARWLGHAHTAARAVMDADGARRFHDALHPIAAALVNEPEPAARGARREARFAPTREAAAACAKGDVDALRLLLDAHPRLVEASEPGSAELLHAAASRGRVAVVAELLHRGLDVNKPARAGAVMVTALCAARLRRKPRVVDQLEAAGAIDDVFSAALLGRVDDLDAALTRDPTLANAPDPASDFYRATVLDHAVLGSAPESTVACVVRHGGRSPDHGHALLHHAATHGLTGVVDDLLRCGADASFVTPGRWVLHDECAQRLIAAGANVNHAPTKWQSWIWQSCSGNHGARDDPEYVRALLAAGADVAARAFGKTALHFAVKAGFVEAVRVLVDANADVNALDDDSRTPADYLDQARPKVDRAALADALARRERA